MIRITSEDVTVPDLSTHPAIVDVSSFLGHPVQGFSRRAFPEDVLADIERAIVDKGWRFGVRSCSLTVEHTPRGGTRVQARLSYGR